MFFRLMLVFLSLAAFGASSCKNRESSASATYDAGSAKFDGYTFVGCGPSAGECMHSCPENNGVGQRDATLCDEGLGSYACYCPGGAPVMEAPPASTHDFVGCVPSASECRYSCNNKRIITFQGSDQCMEREFACYCER